MCYVCTYTYERKKERGIEREREKTKITHINDDGGVDVKQGCGLFSSYASVSVFHASSMSVNIYMLRIREEGPKKQESTGDIMTTCILTVLVGCVCKRM
jgi:hypothetical protein